MRFDEKLIHLRKKNMLSQEGLAEKLNVTRQTVSKWELGQTKPDMDKLVEMSKLFDVSVNDLTDDNVFLESAEEKNINKKENKSNNGGNRKIILYILIIIFIASVTTLSYRIASSIKEKKDAIKEEIKKEKEKQEKKQQEMEEEFKEQQENIQNKIEESKKNAAKDDFNRSYEFWSGTQTSAIVSKIIDDAITNNKKNNEHLIEFMFDGTSYGTDANNIKNIKNSLKDFNGHEIQFYEISLDYDGNGYVNKITIETM